MQTLASRTGAKYFSETPKLVVLNRQILNCKTSRNPLNDMATADGFLVFSFVLEGA